MSEKSVISKQKLKIPTKVFNSKKSTRPKLDHENEQFFAQPLPIIRSSQLYRLPVKIGKHDTKALVDTGAEISILSPKALTKIPPNSITKLLNNNGLILSDFTGIPSIPSGKFKIPITLSEKHNFSHDFYIVPDMIEECILGLDFMHKYGLKFDGQNGTISYDHDGVTCKLINSVTTNKSPYYEPSISIQSVPLVPDLSHVTNNQEKAIKTVLLPFSELFGIGLSDLKSNLPVKHHIHLIDNDQPIFIPHYRTPFNQRPLLEEHISNLLKSGIIRPSSSPYGSPCLLVAKKDGSTRFVVDYRKLNSFTIRDRYPLPRLDESIESFFGARFFSTLDLLSGYHQIEVFEDDKPKTAFTSEFGHFEYNRMPFGLTNAPATFQRLMNNILQQFLYKSVVVYLDDIIIFSKSFELHLIDLQNVFKVLQTVGLKLNLKKCSFFKETVSYLGHVISKNGILPDPSKQRAINNYPVPTNADQIRSFLGLANYYRKFIDNFAEKAHPLTELTKKNAKFEWTLDHSNAFEILKSMLVNSPILRFPDFTRDFLVYTDASGFGVGAILGQVQQFDKTDQEVVIAYYSKHLTERQQRWGVTEREALAILLAVQNFHPYLYGRRFTVYTDHKPLEWLMNLKKPNSRLLRWSLELQQYDIAIGYKPGKTHQNADCLSRIPVNTVNNITTEWHSAQRVDPFCRSMLRTIARSNRTSNDSLQDLLTPTASSGNQTDIPDERDEPPNINRSKRKPRYILLTGNLLGTKKGQIVVPKSKITAVLKRYHDHKLAGHLGITKTLNRIKARFIWPKMEKDIYSYVSTCDVCQKRKSFSNKKALLKSLPIVSRLWERIACDIIGPVTNRVNRYEHILTILEYETRYAKAFALKNTDSSTIAKIIINNIILEHGVPSLILTDRGSNLVSGAMKDICDALQIEQVKTTAYHPQTDGLVEKFNGTLGNMLASYVHQKPTSWPEFLKYVVFAYNTSVHASTKETPFYLLYGHDPMEPNDLLPPTRARDNSTNDNIFHHTWREVRDLAKLHLEAAQGSQKRYYDRSSSPTTQFKVGDKVIMREMRMGLGKFHLRWDGPYTIIKLYPPVNCSIRRLDSLTDIVVHTNRLRLYRERSSSDHSSDSDSNNDTENTSSDDTDTSDSSSSSHFEPFQETTHISSQDHNPTDLLSETPITAIPNQQESISSTPDLAVNPEHSVLPVSGPSNTNQIPSNQLQPKVVLQRLPENVITSHKRKRTPPPPIVSQTTRYPVRQLRKRPNRYVP